MVKKIIILLLSLILVIGLGCGGYWLFTHRSTDGNNKIKITSYDDDGTISTERDWEFVPYKGDEEIKSSIVYDANYRDVNQVRDVPMYIASNTKVNLSIPAGIEYEWDYGKTLYALNGEFKVKIVTAMDDSDLLAKAGIDNPKTVDGTSDVFITNDSTKGPKTICTFIGKTSYGIIADIYKDTNDALNIIGNSLIELSKKGLYNNSILLSMRNDVEKVNALPEIDGELAKYKSSISVDGLYMQLYSKRYEDGNIYSMTVTNPIQLCIRDYVDILEIMSGHKISSYYQDTKIFYSESDEYSLGLIKISNNATTVLIGKGIECRANILKVLKEIE